MLPNDGVIVGMEPAAVFLEGERQNLDEKTLMIGHLALKAFDDFDGGHDVWARSHSFAGFHFDKDSHLISFRHTFAMRPPELVEKAIVEAFPSHRQLMTNSSVDQLGYVITRGMHANDILDHPYTASCLGLLDDFVDVRMSARLRGLQLVDVPLPSEDTLYAMRRTMHHNGRELRHKLEDLMRTMNAYSPKGEADLDSLPVMAACCFTSRDDQVEGRDRDMMVSRRSRFLARYPGARSIFGPFEREDSVLNRIRAVVHADGNLMETDHRIEVVIGSRLWEEFVDDPMRFCDVRTQAERGDHLPEDDAPSFG